MKNRLTELINKKKGPIGELHTYFLACELKPNSPLFSVLEPFAYNIIPAFIYGSLGIISYESDSYAILDTDEKTAMPLIGYILTITEPDTIDLLHSIKGYYGPDSYNMHQKKVVEAFTDVDVNEPAWVFQLSESVLENYEQIEQVEYGLWDENDSNQVEFLEKIGDVL